MLLTEKYKEIREIKQIQKNTLSVVILALLFMGAVHAVAQYEWQVYVAPYMWFAGIDGDVTVGDRR